MFSRPKTESLGQFNIINFLNVKRCVVREYVDVSLLPSPPLLHSLRPSLYPSTLPTTLPSYLDRLYVPLSLPQTISPSLPSLPSSLLPPFLKPSVHLALHPSSVPLYRGPCTPLPIRSSLRSEEHTSAL